MAQAQATLRQQAAPLPEGEPKPRKKRGKLYTMLTLLLLGGAGAAGWYVYAPPAKQADVKQVRATPPVFFPLETFTVNLVPEYGDQYLQVEMTLKAPDQKAIDEIRSRMPEVRNRVLLLLSSMRASQLTPVTGKQRLALGLRSEINMLIDPSSAPPKKIERVEPAPGTPPGANAQVAEIPAHSSTWPVIEVLFTSFIIQ